MKIFKIAYHLLIYFVLTTSAYAANHYICAGATGANNGSDWTNAWTTLPSTLTRGDTYYIADGTYGGYVFDDAASGSTYIYIKKATQSVHGTDTGWNSTYGDGQAVFTGQWSIRSNYLDIDGVTGGGPGSWRSGHGFKVITDPRAGGWLPRNIWFDQSYSGGPGNGSYVNLKHIELTRTTIPGGGESQDYWDDSIITSWQANTNLNMSYLWIHAFNKMGISGAPKNWTLEYSLLEDNHGTTSQHGELIALDGGPGPFLIRYNYFAKWRSTGLLYCVGSTGETINGVQIYGNIIDGTEAESWWVIGGGDGDLIYQANWKIYNNTFINLLSESRVGYFRTGTSGNELKNNIFWNTTTGSRSIFMQNVTNDYGWYTNGWTPQVSDPHAISGGSANPFVNSSSSNFHLSSAISGLSINSPYNQDMDRVIRGSDAVYDRGAFEYNSSIPSLKPMPPEGVRISP